MAMLELSIVPVGTQSTSLSPYVSEVIKVLKKQENVKFELTAMGTILEGDIHELWPVVLKLHDTMFERGAQRVLTSVRIDDRRDKNETIEYKVRSVLDKLDG